MEVGFDAKIALTPSLMLDVTYNTDFAQVEVDEVHLVYLYLSKIGVVGDVQHQTGGQRNFGIKPHFHIVVGPRFGVATPIKRRERIGGNLQRTLTGRAQSAFAEGYPLCARGV